MRYCICYTDTAGNGHFQDVESNSLEHAVWELAKELGTGTLVEAHAVWELAKEPTHVNLYPNWSAE